MARQKFQIGDNVKIVGKITFDAENNFGHEGVITSATLKVWPDRSKKYADEVGNFWYHVDGTIVVYEKDLELISKKYV